MLLIFNEIRSLTKKRGWKHLTFVEKFSEKKIIPDITVTNKAELNFCNSCNWKYCYFCSGP